MHVLQERTGPAELAAAIVHAARAGARSLVLHADEAAGTAARLARCLDPGFEITVREVRGSTSAPATPDPLPVVLPGADDAGPLVSELESIGLEVVLEQGEWRGELAGLEVARIVRWPSETGGDDLLHIEAGVGRFDRDATALMHGVEDPETALRRAMDAVSARRHPGVATNPVSVLARSRWMRSAAVTDPGALGLVDLQPVETTFPPASVREERPAAALGHRGDGESVLVVFGAGTGFELVPVAVDTRELQAPGRTVVLVVPPRDHMASLDELVAAGSAAGRGVVELIEVDPPWAT